MLTRKTDSEKFNNLEKLNSKLVFEINKMEGNIICIPRSAHRTPNYTNSEFQFPQFKVLQSVFIFLCVKSYIGIF